MWSTISLEALTPDISVLTINRPESLNSLNAQTLRDLAEAAGQLQTSEAKVVKVRGSGRAFSAGADFELLHGLDDGVALDPREAGMLGGEMADAIEAIPAVTVAELRGAVVGGGLVLAAACDLRMASSDTYFSIPEVDIGLPLGWGGVPRLVREIGPALTRELVMTCRPFTAEEAQRAGFINRVVETDDLESAVDALIAVLAAKPRYALLGVKATVAGVIEEVASARNRPADADLLAGAFSDEESRAAAETYFDARRSR